MGRVPADAGTGGTAGAPWLRPTAAGLYALTADPPDRDIILRDPGLVAHVLRFARPTPDPRTFALSAAVLTHPGLCESAAALLESPGGTGPDWQTAAGATHVRTGRLIAHVAAKLAREFRLCSPDAAWAGGLLAPLGWYAAAQHSRQIADPDAVARRAAGRWRLPTPFAVAVGFPGFAPDDAVRLGAHRGLFRAVRAAAAAVSGTSSRDDADLLAAAKRIAAETSPADPRPVPAPSIEPAVLVRLLRATAAARNSSGSVLVGELEHRVDQLAGALVDLRAGFDSAVRDAKLSALAEFAAGASHEINNPLAVISGNAQLLEPGEADPARQRKLAAIVRGTRRIHDILLGTHQFACPHPPRPALIPVAPWLTAELDRHQPDAFEKGVTLTATGADDDFVVTADPAHARDALGHLLRNAIAASPRGGVVAIRVEIRDAFAAIVVEDAGPGPRPADVDHLFDPFFSGRAAGRGRGLGLSIAWRLAAVNGGSVAFEPSPTGPTRFTLTLPIAATAGVRKSA